MAICPQSLKMSQIQFIICQAPTLGQGFGRAVGKQNNSPHPQGSFSLREKRTCKTILEAEFRVNDSTVKKLVNSI